jgi:hypothetical protein
VNCYRIDRRPVHVAENYADPRASNRRQPTALLMDKTEIFQAILSVFRATLADHEKAAGAARESASGDEVSSDGKYDTRATESSYLARGHAMQYEAMVGELRTLEAYRVPQYEPDEEIGTGALVEVKVGRAKAFYFILPSGGGTEALVRKTSVIAINARSPAGKEFKGKCAGASFQIPGAKSKGEISSVS